MKAHLLNSVLKLRTSKSEVLKSTNNKPVEGSIRSRRTIRGRKLGLRINWRSGRLAVKHARSLQKLVGVLLLVQEEASSPAHYLDAEEVVQGPQVLEGELGAEASCDLLKKR